MSRHQKQLTKKQKIVIYSSTAAAAVIAAIGAVILVVHTVKNPPEIIFNSNSGSYISNLSSLSDSTDIIPKPVITVKDENNEETPVITGVKDGATYYTTQCVTISNHNLASVTLNGEKCSNVFLIDGNAEDVYEILVTDINGNTTKTTVYTMPINSILDPLGGINEYTATQSDKSSIKAIKDSALKIDTRYSPYEETQTLEIIITACDLMLERIDAAVNELERIKSLVTEYQDNGVTNADNDNLTKLFSDIQMLLTSQNLTEEQMSELRIIKSECRAWIDDTTPTNYDLPAEQ